MTLARKMIAGAAAPIIGLLLLAAASLWGLAGINRNLGQALDEYDALRRYYEVGLDVARAREALAAAAPDPVSAADRVRAAMVKFEHDTPAADDAESQRVRPALREALTDITALRAGGIGGGGEIQRAMARLNGVLNTLGALSQRTRQRVSAIDAERGRRMRATLMTLAALWAVVVAAAAAIGAAQYRGVMRPLRRLAAGVRHIAAGRFTGRLPTGGDDELARLSEDFNRMAVELDGLYRELEAKVDAKSRELIRSERLASVGYLAAGVAHEINNPLSIIAGHAELSLRALERGEGGAAGDAHEGLRVIASEAFRCKQITDKLLSLLRGGGGEGRTAVSVDAAAREVIALTAALPRHRGRSVTLTCDESQDLRVAANEVELKQVLLNLVVNALEAVEAGGGRVEVAARRVGEAVEVAVADNGKGMTAQTLGRVFEPFFTEKRGTDEAGATAGVGLGLSITHAIVAGHGGRLRAESEGLGKGSRFIVEWPGAASLRGSG